LFVVESFGRKLSTDFDSCDFVSGSGIFRENMTRPGVYWPLDAPFVRIIGLYSNRMENPGYPEDRDSKGKVDQSQITWLQST